MSGMRENEITSERWPGDCLQRPQKSLLTFGTRDYPNLCYVLSRGECSRIPVDGTDAATQ